MDPTRFAKLATLTTQAPCEPWTLAPVSILLVSAHRHQATGELRSSRHRGCEGG